MPRRAVGAAWVQAGRDEMGGNGHGGVVGRRRDAPRTHAGQNSNSALNWPRSAPTSAFSARSGRSCERRGRGGGRDEHARESARERRSVVSERAPGGTYHRVEGPPERRPQVEALVDGLGLGRQPAGAGRRRGCAALVQRQGRQQVLGRLLEDADVEACRPTWGGGKPASVSACGRGDEGDEDGAPVTHTTRRGCRRPG